MAGCGEAEDKSRAVMIFMYALHSLIADGQMVEGIWRLYILHTISIYYISG